MTESGRGKKRAQPIAAPASTARRTKTKAEPAPAPAATTRRATKPKPAPKKSPAATPTEGDEHSPVVLVVDDEADVREWLRLSLALEGWTVEEAVDGEAALELWRKITPDVVLLDQRLKGMSGFECAEKIRSMSEDTRIIMVSGYLDPDATKEARRLRILPIEKADHKRLFELLALLADQVRGATKSKVC